MLNKEQWHKEYYINQAQQTSKQLTEMAWPMLASSNVNMIADIGITGIKDTLRNTY